MAFSLGHKCSRSPDARLVQSLLLDVPDAAVGAIFQMQLPSLDIGNGCSEQPPSVAKTTKPFN